MKTLLTLLFAASLFVVGCGGGGGGGTAELPPQAEKPSDMWQGVAYHDNGTEESVTCMITRGLKVYCATDGEREFDGKISELDGEKAMQIDYDWSPEVDARNKGAGEGHMDCEWSPHNFIDCDYVGFGKDGQIESGRVLLIHRDNHPDGGTCLLNRRLNQAHVAGTWIDEGGPIPMLSIDRVGRAFGHNAITGCYFSGNVTQVANPLLDPWRNFYTVGLLIESCEAEGYDAFNGKMLRGIAHLDDAELRNDTLTMMAGAKSQEGPAAFTAYFRRR